MAIRNAIMTCLFMFSVGISSAAFGNTELPHPFDDIPPLVDMALEAFGPKRMMWGSDYPPVSSREGYDNALNRPMEYLSGLSEDEREWIFGRTALKVWGFE